MKGEKGIPGVLGLSTVLIAVALFTAGASAWSYADDSTIERGDYLVRAGGCISCHTDKKGNGAPFAGGRGLKTPFGIYYSPNITPDPETGIGKWTDADFVQALRRGLNPKEIGRASCRERV